MGRLCGVSANGSLVAAAAVRGGTMDRIDISAEDTVRLDSVATGLVGLRILLVNVFAVVTDSGWTFRSRRRDRRSPGILERPCVRAS
jgi:hypothetical protein